MKNRTKWRMKWWALLREMGMVSCSKCGYDKCFAAIDYHHPEGVTKTISIGEMITKPITPERIAEIKKTIPVCANCHREIHFAKYAIGDIL